MKRLLKREKGHSEARGRFSKCNLVSLKNIAYKSRQIQEVNIPVRVPRLKSQTTNGFTIMAEIKSTLEKVLERAASMGRASQEEIQAEEKVREGMRLAADYLQERDIDFSMAQEATSGSALIRKGLVLVFLRNITLPRDDDQQRAEKAMQGLLDLNKGSGDLMTICKEMKVILNHYQQHKKEIRRQVEDAFRQQMEHALAQQTGQNGLGMKVDPVLHPKFQEEWSRIKADLNAKYNEALDQHKKLVAQRFAVVL
jgi:hypothetical protein